MTTDNREPLNFTLSIQDPPFERHETVQHDSIVSIPLPQSLLPSSPSLDSETSVLGIKIKTQARGSSIRVFLSPNSSGLFPANPCSRAAGERKGSQAQYSYHVFPAARREQPATRSTLLLVGCQDATTIEISSTVALSLPVSLNATTSEPISSDLVITSFVLGQLDTAAIPLAGDISRTHLVSDKPLTVSVVSTAHCSITTPSGVSSRVCGTSYRQIAPSVTWGRTFLVSSRPRESEGAEYIIQTGVSHSTSVQIICSNSTHTDTRSFSQYLQLERASSFVFKATSRHYCSIEAQQEVQVLQYPLRQASSVTDTIFPLVIPPTEQYSTGPTLLPLLTSNQEIVSENDGEFEFYATIFVPVLNGEDFEIEARRVLVDGTLVSGQWHNIFCKSSKLLCGYVIEVRLPKKQSINITHESVKVPFSALIHRVGAMPFSYPAVFRLNDLSGLACTVLIR